MNGGASPAVAVQRQIPRAFIRNKKVYHNSGFDRLSLEQIEQNPELSLCLRFMELCSLEQNQQNLGLRRQSFTPPVPFFRPTIAKKSVSSACRRGKTSSRLGKDVKLRCNRIAGPTQRRRQATIMSSHQCEARGVRFLSSKTKETEISSLMMAPQKNREVLPNTKFSCATFLELRVKNSAPP